MADQSLTISLEKALRSTFIEQLKAEPSLVDKLATTVKSGARSEDFAWVGESPALKSWAAGAERDPQIVSEAKYTVDNARFEATISCSRMDLDDDQVGGLPLRIRQLAQRAQQHKNSLVISALVGGEALACYDGSAYFGDHPARGSQSATQSNIIQASGNTTAAISSDLSSCIATMRKFKDEHLQPLNSELAGSLTIVASPDLERSMTEVLESGMIESSDNVMKQKASLLISSRLEGDSWYCLNTGDVVRPLLYSDRDPIEFAALESSSDMGFKSEQYMYGVRYRGAVGFSHWGKAVKVKA